MPSIYKKPSDGSGEEELLFQTKMQVMPMGWSPDGQFLIFWQNDPKMLSDLWILPLDDKKPRGFLNTPFNESHGQISPDGKWIAYLSNESGQTEVYVSSFPSGSGKKQVSLNGGTFPRWRANDGKEIFYLTSQFGGKMMAVEVKTSGPKLDFGTPKELFDSQFQNFSHPGHTGNWHTYAVSPDGQRFLIPRPVSQQVPGASVTVVLNWTALLKR